MAASCDFLLVFRYFLIKKDEIKLKKLFKNMYEYKLQAFFFKNEFINRSLAFSIQFQKSMARTLLHAHADTHPHAHLFPISAVLIAQCLTASFAALKILFLCLI